MKCFISHNWKDKDTAEEIGRRLLQHGIDVWLDKWEMYAGESLTTGIAEGIRNSNVFIILMSSNSMNSQWVKEELRIALQRRLKDPDFKLIPILLNNCEITEFLQDYIYIDWQGDTNKAFESLLRAVKQVSVKPEYIKEQIKCSIEYKKVVHKLELTGYRGEITKIDETFQAHASSAIKRMDRGIHFSGELDDVKSDLFDISRKRINPQYEKWVLHPERPLEKDNEFSYMVEYQLSNCFNNEQEYWFYTVEAPTDRLIIMFDFQNASKVKEFTVYHRQGQTLLDEPIQPVMQHNGKYAWEKLFPVYKDTYEFHFRWAE